jgi:plasmid stabilization system protein ParE
MGDTKEKIQKPYQVRITENAYQNIDDITSYIAYINHQPLNAIKVGDAIFETAERICMNPYAYKECEEIPTIRKIYRKAVCMSWLIIYRIKSNEIVIIGILHASRRPSKVKQLRKIK